MSEPGELTGPLDLTDRTVLARWLSRVRDHVVALEALLRAAPPMPLRLSPGPAGEAEGDRAERASAVNMDVEIAPEAPTGSMTSDPDALSQAA